MRDRGRRPVVATKVFHSVTGDSSDRGLAPDRIERELHGSLERLGLDRVDLYLIHAPDPDTPLEETLEALDGHVRAGRVGAIGASNVDAAYLREALAISDRRGLTRFDWVQNSRSLLDRGSDDVLDLCAREGLGFTPFGPLAGGWLAGRYRRGEPPPEGSRMTLRPEPYEHLRTERVWTALERFAGEAGAQVFTSAGCGGCHTLEDAGATGAVGVNLDELQPTFQTVAEAVITGPGAMPSFSDQLSPEEIRDVAAYVAAATR